MIYIVWEFTISVEQRAPFESAYKSDGVWAQLFRRDRAYRQTTLIHDTEQSGRYLTIDVWEDRDSYLSFKERFAADYHKIDEDCERLTLSERLVGIFEALS
jgi:hypothetical protein